MPFILTFNSAYRSLDLIQRVDTADTAFLLRSVLSSPTMNLYLIMGIPFPLCCSASKTVQVTVPEVFIKWIPYYSAGMTTITVISSSDPFFIASARIASHLSV